MTHDSGIVDASLRVAGRLAVLAGISFAALFILGIALKPVLPGGLPAGRDGRVLFLFLVTLALGVGHLVVSVVLERGRWELAGLGPRALQPLGLVAAPGLGLLALGIPFAALLLAGWIALEPAPAAGGLPVGDVVTLVAVATLLETLIFRGYLQGLLEVELSPGLGILLAALGATAYRHWGQGLPLLAWAASLCASLFYGALRQRSGSLPAAWLAQLGLALPLTLLLREPLPHVELLADAGVELALSGPAIWTGGSTGLATGLAAAIGCLLLAAAVLWRWPAPKAQIARR